MKRLTLTLTVFSFLAFGIFSCTPEQGVDQVSEIPQSVLEKITDLGFSIDGAFAVEGGYIIEGDIFMSNEQLESSPYAITVPDVEQYSTFNLVTGTPRVINLWVDGKLPSSYDGYTQDAAARFNSENLNITFQVVNKRKDADIKIQAAPRNAGYLASAGFPTSTGDPHNSVKMNVGALNGQPNGTVVSVLAHEIGHCIGFRHTDWFDRSISCGGSPVNEGQSTSGVGAVHIPGTPTGADLAGQGSFMLSCIGSGQNRPFTSNDVTALNYLY